MQPHRVSCGRVLPVADGKLPDEGGITLIEDGILHDEGDDQVIGNTPS